MSRQYAGCTAVLLFFVPIFLLGQNPLLIPPLITGDTFTLELRADSTEFFPGYKTPTYGANGPILAPTLEMQKGNDIGIHVHNTLPVATTIHWHGLHVPAMDDGGPHQSIAAGGVWEPTFKMLNEAGTYWYHPHGEGKTELHVGKGLAGFILVRDSAEAALPLPRTYGVDDFPILLQTKAFDVLRQIAIASEDDTLHMVNATVDPYVELPAQVVRLRLLNGSSMRTFLLGLTGDMPFHVIGSDGGLLDTARAVTRLRISPGERYEVLVDLGAMAGDTLYLNNVGSELPNGIYGAADVGMGMASIPDYDLNPLNGGDYSLLQIRVTGTLPGAILTVPSALVPFTPWLEADADTTRLIDFTAEMIDPSSMVMGPFLMNGAQFHIDSVNIRTRLGNIEVWTLTNNTQIAHPFHIHDIQFYLLEDMGFVPSPIHRGRKDVVLVQPMSSVRFITRFETFTDDLTPYMYHCHLLHHEDEGMMGSFLVLDTASVSITDPLFPRSSLTSHPNPAASSIIVKGIPFIAESAILSITDLSGHLVFSQALPAWHPESLLVSISDLPQGIFFLNYESGWRNFTYKISIQR